MGKALSSLFGGDNSSEIAAQNQRQALASLANQQAEVDQATASTSTGKKGRRLLMAVGAPGVAKLGG